MTTRYGRGRQLAQYEVDYYERVIAKGAETIAKVMLLGGLVLLNICAVLFYLANVYTDDSGPQIACGVLLGMLLPFGVAGVVVGGILCIKAASNVRKAREALKRHEWWKAYRADRAKHDYFAHDDGDYDDLR